MICSLKGIIQTAPVQGMCILPSCHPRLCAGFVFDPVTNRYYKQGTFQTQRAVARRVRGNGEGNRDDSGDDDDDDDDNKVDLGCLRGEASFQGESGANLDIMMDCLDGEGEGPLGNRRDPSVPCRPSPYNSLSSSSSSFSNLPLILRGKRRDRPSPRSSPRTGQQPKRFKNSSSSSSIKSPVSAAADQMPSVGKSRSTSRSVIARLQERSRGSCPDQVQPHDNFST